MLYQYDFSENHAMMLICGVVAIILLILIAILIFAKNAFVIKKGSSDKIAYNQFNIIEKALCRYIPIIIITIGLIGLLNIIVSSASFEYKMKHDGAIVLAGECEVMDVEEAWYRDEFLGYDITMKINGKTIEPANHFSENQIALFQAHAHIVVYYGFAGKELFVYQIKNE